MTEEALFHVARDLPPAERAAFLAEHCPDADQRRRVEELLAAHDRSAGPLDSPPTGEYESAASQVPDTAGLQIGPYKLLQRIGEGGMGAVYMAEQTSPVRRMVAIKLIKPGMDSRQVIARFEAERQALALMDHPSIAKVLDAGTTQNDHPYFVMELVKGVPITRYCDQQHLTPRERLELFVPVCHAVQHAHQKGIIHRDLKPTNVLVALYDGRPVPKVIDFGVAKATGGKLTDRTMFTEFGAVVGTLEYMSPEQAELNQLDIDTRSDIYSLGVLLYELLTGSTPFDRKRLKSAAFDELLRIIREEEPPKPSTRLSGSEELPAIAANRRTEPKRLGKLVRGELDWVVMKCLEKDRGRRYETANGLAMDVQRYLADDMVQARPPTAGYRLRKFVRRYKGPVLAAGFALLALLTGTAGTTWGLIQANQQRKVAEQQRDDANRARAAEAEQRQLAENRKEEVKQHRVKAVQAVAEMYEVTGVAASKMKDWKLAKESFRKAVPSYEELVRDYPASRQYAMGLVKFYCHYGQVIREAGEQSASLDWYNKAVATCERLLRVGPAQETDIFGDIAGRYFGSIILRGRAEALSGLGRPAEALADWDRALALCDDDDVCIGRALFLARTGQPTPAIAAADELSFLSATQCYEVARVYAVSTNKLSSADADGVAAKAVTAVRKALAAGYRDIPDLLKDPDLAPLRRRADYAELLWDLADLPAPPAGKGAAP